MSLILPKGFVVNAAGLNGDIERINQEPLDVADIAKFWKVYTTTKRRLLDPTAERLENYWWRIWGSRKKSLNGATVARLFAHISDGQTFVPLRGPPNRDEGTPPLTTAARRGPTASSTTALNRSDPSRPSTTASSIASRNPAPMPHPILKKTRGPSTSGPRPTARFISPPESDGEADPSSSASTNSQTNSHVVVEPPSPDSQNVKFDRKSPPSNKKKGGFVASARKKRPVIVRRQSSQTSQSSTEAVPSIASVQSSAGRTPPAVVEQSRNPPQSRFQENFSPPPDRSKSPKKRNTLRVSDSKRTPPRNAGVTRGGKASHSDEIGERVSSSGDPGPSAQLRRIENLQTEEVPAEDLTAEDLEEIEVQRSLLAEANARVKEGLRTAPSPLPSATSDGFRILHRALRPQSEGNVEQKSLSAVQLLDHETKGTASLAPTLTDATGQVNLGNVGIASSPNSTSKKDKGKGRNTEDVPGSGMFAKRTIQPVPPVVVPDSTGSLTRSKSQLTLLLERDRARSGEHKSDDEKSNRRKR
ncbi:hypothetical protein N431DRAFT_354125 [Stipitochalara longipes BDJ]|nr:hypothetical protein N431DRAFT_354125 [Stipitochalara longipes BDJ]